MYIEHIIYHVFKICLELFFFYLGNLNSIFVNVKNVIVHFILLGKSGKRIMKKINTFYQ